VTRSAVREVSRGSFYLGLEQLTLIVGGVFSSILVLRMLGPGTYGILSLGQAAIGLAAVLTTNIETYLERFVAEYDARGMGGILRRLVTKIVATKMLLAFVVMVLVVVLAGPIADVYKHGELRRLLPVLAPLIMLEGASWLLRLTLFGLQRFRSIWIVALGNNFLKLVIVFGLWTMHKGVIALVSGFVAVQIATVIGQTILVLRYLPASTGPDKDVPSQRRIWGYVLPLLGGQVFFLSGQNLNRLILGALLPARELGLAAFALMTVERFIALLTVVSSALLPTLSRLRGEQRHDAIETVVTEGYRLVAALAVAMTVGVLCLAREAVLITGGAEYVGAILPLQILSLIPLFRTMQQPLNTSFLTYEKTKTVFWLAGLKFAMEPLAYPLLIPHFGVAGVAMASLFSSVVVFGPTTFIADRLFRKTIGARRRVTATAWAIGAAIVLASWLAHRAGEPWPGMTIRIGILVGGLGMILLAGRMVNGDDLRSLAHVTRRAAAVRALSATAGWLDRIQRRAGRPETAS